MRRGLVVGKFSPLHKGHEWLINTAASQCDQLLILSYSNPEFSKCETAIRAEWLMVRFPHIRSIVIDPSGPYNMPNNDAPDHIQQEFLAHLLKNVISYTPDVLFCSERYGPPCCRVLTKVLNHHVECKVLDVVRYKNPISATEIRTDPYYLREWMPLIVRSSFITQRIALLGGESTGKTTLAKALANTFNTCWVPEYGRELFETKNGDLDIGDMLKIAKEQLHREVLPTIQANRFVFCDTSPLTTTGYSQWMFNEVDPELQGLSKTAYDAVILCKPDFPFVSDGTRKDNTFRMMQDSWYREKVGEMTCPIAIIGGNLDERIETVTTWLGAL